LARWITSHADLAAYIVDEILREEVWWVATRSRKYAHHAIVWADGDIPTPQNGSVPYPAARSLIQKTRENFRG
jgi:hypothetical protein